MTSKPSWQDGVVETLDPSHLTLIWKDGETPDRRVLVTRSMVVSNEELHEGQYLRWRMNGAYCEIKSPKPSQRKLLQHIALYLRASLTG
jgi:hypothetical protein